jgi:thioredoxin-related protein
MKIRIFGSYDCKNCLKVFILIKKLKVNFEYIDAFDEKKEIQDLCDKYNVDDFPHLQFIDNKDEIIIEHKGPIDEEDFFQYLIDYSHIL